jgi:hypothetical protein
MMIDSRQLLWSRSVPCLLTLATLGLVTVELHCCQTSEANASGKIYDRDLFEDVITSPGALPQPARS